jgi:hypothetical protein
MPTVARFLCVQMQGSSPHLWALVEPSSPKKPRRIVMYGTGWVVAGDAAWWNYIGTVQADGFVWHYGWSSEDR